MESVSSNNNHVILWTPPMPVDKKAVYAIDPDDFIDKINLNPYTVFEEGGSLIKISGLRLHVLLTTPVEKKTKPIFEGKKSKKNICMKNTNNIIQLLMKKIKMPPCINKFLKDLQEPRGGMYCKRFIVNCYILNVVTCTKCRNQCILSALSDFYRGDIKCVNELTHLMVKSQNIYKPPNCIKLKTVDKLCPIVGQCKGSNPICNF
ncbi:LEF-2 [Parapoynx stagnalis nucleopolyhedrovirus]|uniref:LEF-2 n=1 Tax=Parapoynx stagnalis nucleopolyhedrovirus TaxID=2993413 RepID=A0A9E7YJ96_9ABAC|nr:LEF-2 [Parapoynx stagnalis nucleopolyhedrovirus]